MRKILLFLCFSFFAILNFSCHHYVDFADFEVYLAGEKINAENPTSYTINLDAVDKSSLILDLKVKLYKYDSEHFANQTDFRSSYSYEFTASSLSVKFQSVGNDGFEKRVDLSSLPVGTYKFYAKMIDPPTNKEDWYNFSYTITITSGLQHLQASYSLDSIYRVSNIDYQEEELEGLVYFKNNNINLVANSSYSFEVSDYTGQIQNIQSLVISSSDELNTEIQYTQGTAFFKVYFSGANKDKITLTISIAQKREVYLQLNISLIDRSSQSLVLQEQFEEKDTILSFTANPPDYQNKEYSYILETNTPQYVVKQPVFSIDVEEWNNEEEQRFLSCQQNHTKFTPTYNENPTWYTASEFIITKDNEVKFKVRFDGTNRSVIITPLADTISQDGTYNLHTYIYWKWKDEKDILYRGKYRIMVGGVLDSISLFRVTEKQNEDITASDIQLNPGDNSSFDVIVNYNPLNIQKTNNRVLFYLAKDLNLSQYTFEGKTLSLPTPVSKTSAIGKTIDFSSAIDTSPYPLIDETNTNVSIPYYSVRDMSSGTNSLWLRYNPTGEKVYVIVLDIKTGLWTYFSIKQSNSTGEVILKSQTPAPSTLYLYKTSSSPFRSFYSTSPSLTSNSYGQSISKIKVYSTTYNGTEIQEYPKTIQADSENYRTFIFSLNEEIKIDIETTFEIENISVEQTADSSEVLVIKEGKNSANRAKVSISSFYYTQEEDLKRQINEKGEKDKYITPEDGVYFTVILNDTIQLPFRVICYK